MIQIKQILTLSLFALFLVGCGGKSNKPAAAKGDKFVVEEEIFENAEIRLDGYVDGVKVTLPVGTVLEVLFKPPTSSNFIECIPVELNKVTDSEEIESTLIPEKFLNNDGYTGYSFAINKDYIGSKIKKVD
ncbi:MAG: hypothetical protein Q4F84_10965 [Fibrobacter sp.]|nr:hypothetical protein [Fibrobacter sp.]